MNSVKEKVVFITGASSGIGAACATYFARAGAKLILCARKIDRVNQLAEMLRNHYQAHIHTFYLDVRKHSEIKKSINGLPEEWKKIDILINNAGLAAGLELIQEGLISDWEEMIDTNIKGLLYMTREVLPQMVERNAGHIINIGSIAGHQVYPRGAVYCATKFAVNAISAGLRMDLLGTPIRVTTIDPGMVKTNFSHVRFKGNTERAEAVYAGIDALTPEDIADTALYCATRPLHVNISEVIMMPTNQASATLIARET